MKVERVGDGITFFVKVQPKASKNEVVGIEGEYLKIKVTAPPFKGKANKECVKLISKWLRVRPSQVEIEKGETSRLKKIKIKGDPQKLMHIIKNLVDSL